MKHWPTGTPPKSEGSFRLTCTAVALAISACSGRIDYNEDPEAPAAASSGNSAGELPSEPTPVEVAGLVEALDFGLPAATAETHVLASIAEGRYRQGFPWVHVNDFPFPSSVAIGKTIGEWVSGIGAEAYAEVAPDADHEPESELPPGTLIVREVLDEQEEVSAITLMLKGPPGYNPDLGDFWFGALNGDGSAKLNEDTGEPRLGRLEDCYGCHVPRAPQGFIFGAPADNRSPDMTMGALL